MSDLEKEMLEALEGLLNCTDDMLKWAAACRKAEKVVAKAKGETK